MSLPDKETLQRRQGEALRRLREDRGLTHAQVAERMGKKPSAGTQISRWERGRESPSGYQLWGFLIAIESNFADLERELNPKPPTNRRLREIALELQALARED